MVEKVVAFKLKAADRVIKEIVEPISDVGNPEKLIKKEYSQWTPEDLQKLVGIYGTSSDSPLTNLIFKREFEKVKRLEEEV